VKGQLSGHHGKDNVSKIERSVAQKLKKTLEHFAIPFLNRLTMKGRFCIERSNKKALPKINTG
jgi:hypothetical protein